MNKEAKELIGDMKKYIRDPFYILVPERYNVEKLLDYINQLEIICNNFMDYLDKNKLVLQNPNILDFYWEMKQLARGK